MRWDNVGFDGPVVTGWREYSAPDSLTPYQGPVRLHDGRRAPASGRATSSPRIPERRGRVDVRQTTCTYDGEGRNVGYVVPNVDETVAPVAAAVFRRAHEAARRARAWCWRRSTRGSSGTDVSSRPRTSSCGSASNGGAWHDRFVTAVEANAFTDFSPDLGGAGASAGLLNQVIDSTSPSCATATTCVELQPRGTWTGTYRVSVTGVDLVLDAGP